MSLTLFRSLELLLSQVFILQSQLISIARCIAIKHLKIFSLLSQLSELIGHVLAAGNCIFIQACICFRCSLFGRIIMFSVEIGRADWRVNIMQIACRNIVSNWAPLELFALCCWHIWLGSHDCCSILLYWESESLTIIVRRLINHFVAFVRCSWRRLQYQLLTVLVVCSIV